MLQHFFLFHFKTLLLGKGYFSSNSVSANISMSHLHITGLITRQNAGIVVMTDMYLAIGTVRN